MQVDRSVDTLAFGLGSHDALPVEERGPWLATSLGGMWSISHPHARDVFLEDIASGLSRTCRYGGQIRADAAFYSVAEHCVLMTEWAIYGDFVRTREDALAILLHDASEAYFGDMPTPLKKMLPEFKILENRAQATIERAFGLEPAVLAISHDDIKVIDRRIRLDERAALILDPALTAGRDVRWSDESGLSPLRVNVRGLDPIAARADFLETFAWVCENMPSVSKKPDLAQAQIDRARRAPDLLAEMSL